MRGLRRVLLDDFLSKRTVKFFFKFLTVSSMAEMRLRLSNVLSSVLFFAYITVVFLFCWQQLLDDQNLSEACIVSIVHLQDMSRRVVLDEKSSIGFLLHWFERRPPCAFLLLFLFAVVR